MTPDINLSQNIQQATNQIVAFCEDVKHEKTQDITETRIQELSRLLQVIQGNTAVLNPDLQQRFERAVAQLMRIQLVSFQDEKTKEDVNRLVRLAKSLKLGQKVQRKNDSGTATTR